VPHIRTLFDCTRHDTLKTSARAARINMARVRMIQYAAIAGPFIDYCAHDPQCGVVAASGDLRRCPPLRKRQHGTLVEERLIVDCMEAELERNAFFWKISNGVAGRTDPARRERAGKRSDNWTTALQPSL